MSVAPAGLRTIGPSLPFFDRGSGKTAVKEPGAVFNSPGCVLFLSGGTAMVVAGVGVAVGGLSALAIDALFSCNCRTAPIRTTATPKYFE